MNEKFIFKVKSYGITYTLGDVNLMVPKTLSKTVRLSWSLAGLEIHTTGTTFIVAVDGVETECNSFMLIPWHETTFRLIKEEICFAEIAITLTINEDEWAEFKSHIANEAECFVAEIYELNSKLHRCTSSAYSSLDSYDLINSSIRALEKHYTDGRVDGSLYTEMISKWSNLKYLIACRISASADEHQVLSNLQKREVVNYIVSYSNKNL